MAKGKETIPKHSGVSDNPSIAGGRRPRRRARRALDLLQECQRFLLMTEQAIGGAEVVEEGVVQELQKVAGIQVGVLLGLCRRKGIVGR